MDILSATFGGGAAVEIWVGAVVFLLMYLTGFVLFQKWRRISMPTPVVHRHIISGLSAALAAMAVAFWLHAANSATASAKEQAGSAIAPQDLRSPVETKLMPVLRFEDQSVIYSGAQLKTDTSAKLIGARHRRARPGDLDQDGTVPIIEMAGTSPATTAEERRRDFAAT